MTSKAAKVRSKDLGMAAVERVHREMQIDEPWTVREERGFTWWGAWVRQRVWAGPAIRSRGETLWHVRARTPVYRDQPDEPATYARVNEWNALWPMGALAYDPDDGTISARTGAFLYAGVDPWLETFLLMAVGLQASLAWLGAETAEGVGPRDAEPHPVAGPRLDPDDMLNLAGSTPKVPSPITASILRTAAAGARGRGLRGHVRRGRRGPRRDPADVRGRGRDVDAADGGPPDPRAGCAGAPGPAASDGVLSGRAWIANALNLAEAADWTGEDRPHAFGAWTVDDGRLGHNAFFPAVLLGGGDEDAAVIVVRNLAAWGGVRARFAGERLPWLEAAAVSRYPDDEPVASGNDDGTGDSGEEETAAEPVPWDQRSFGRAARTPRPRADAATGRPARDLLVDPRDPAAFAEIDDAVAAAEDGDRILVRPGTYRTPVVVDRAVRIEGDGDAAAIVLEPVGGEALGFAVSGASVEGLTIRPARAGNDGEHWSAVAVHNVEATVEGCLLSTHLGATVWVGGPNSSALVLGCTITGGHPERRLGLRGGTREGRRHAHRGQPLADDGGRHPRRPRDHGLRDRRQPRRGRCGHRWGAARHRGLRGVGQCRDRDPAGGRRTIVAGRGLHGGAQQRRGDPGRRRPRLLGAPQPGPRQRRRHRRARGRQSPGGGERPRRQRDRHRRARPRHGPARHRQHRRRDTPHRDRRGRGGRGPTSRATPCRTPAGPGIWVDDAGSAPDFSGNQVSASGAAGVLVTDGAGGRYRSNDLRGNAAGSWKLDRPGDLERTGNLEDTGRAPLDVLDVPDVSDRPAGAPGRPN